MIGALWTGISGLAAEQTALDNEAHNIANVNTIGYKASRISFADQMYQDKIGKGAKILDAEKLFKQGGLKLTGVAHDMALNGDGFFPVANKSANGTVETFYTRAGNFRMGDNGTLQDSAGNEVQGWAMSPLDKKVDVKSTNPNVSVFTNDYNQLITTKIVSHSKYIETYTAKATDYSQTAKSDSSTVFDGAGYKSKSVKVKDVEELIKDYTAWVTKIQETPDGPSATSIAQASQISFAGTDFKKEGDQIYVFINGDRVGQKFISEVTTHQLTTDDLDSSGTVDQADQNLAASRIATYKALANKISNIAGFEAKLVTDGTSGNGIFEGSDTFRAIAKIDGTSNATSLADAKEMLKGMIEIKSLIPGKAFTITEVAELAGSNTIYGSYNESVSATASSTGQGIGALESSREALMEAIVGKQRDVYSATSELSAMDGIEDFTYQLTIYDKDLGKNITVPTVALSITNPTNIDDFVTAINSAPLSSYVRAENINNNLVIKTLDKNSDVEFSGTLKGSDKSDFIASPYSASVPASGTDAEVGTFTINAPISTTKAYQVTFDYDGVSKTIDIAINAAATPGTIATAIAGHGDITTATAAGNNITITANDTNKAITNFKLVEITPDTVLDKNADFSGREGAGAEFIEIINTIDQTSSKGSLQLRLDTLGISNSPFGKFRVDATGLITMKQDGAEIAVGQVAIALFNNQRGLDPVGDNLFAKTNNSGDPIYNINNDKTAKIVGKSLELSTADLSESLVNLMVFQRAFEANAKSITTADQLLTTLIGLKR